MVSDACTEASRQMAKEAGWSLIAKLGVKAIPYLIKYVPKLLKWIPGIGKTLAGHAGKKMLWQSVGRGALSHGRIGSYLGGGIGALGGALGAAPGESRLLGALKGGAGGAVAGGLSGATVGGIGGAARYGLAPSMYRGAGAMQVGAKGKLTPAGVPSFSPERAREIALGGGRYTAARPFMGETKYRLQPRGLGRALSWLPGAATTALYMGGGGEAAGTVPGVARSVGRPMAGYGPRFGGVMPHQLPFVRYTGGWPKASQLGEFVKKARDARVHAIVLVLEKSAGQLPQFDTVPLSSHTAVADYIKNKKYKPEPNEFTSDDQALLNRLVAGMSKSRARVVGAHRRARKEPQQLLKERFQAAGLWS